MFVIGINNLFYVIKITQIKGEITMDNIQKRRYEKAVQIVENRTDLNPKQKEFYLDYLANDKESVLNYDK